MSPIQLTVLTGVLILITAMNLKLAIWYIDRKQAKRALQHYSNQEESDNTAQVHLPFMLAEIKCANSIANNINQYLDALTSQKLEKIGIMKDDTIVAVMIPLEGYEKLLEYVSQARATEEKAEQ